MDQDGAGQRLPVGKTPMKRVFLTLFFAAIILSALGLAAQDIIFREFWSEEQEAEDVMAFWPGYSLVRDQLTPLSGTELKKKLISVQTHFSYPVTVVDMAEGRHDTIPTTTSMVIPLT